MTPKDTAPDGRPVVEVVLGVLIDRQKGLYLMGSRPEGKPYAGYWEFPGGKVEPGENDIKALRREFVEELGIELIDITPWFVLEHSYEHAYVRLHYYRVWRWDGEPQARENQSFAWFGLGQYDHGIQMLPMNATVVRRMTIPAVLATVADPQSALQNLDLFANVEGLVLSSDNCRSRAYIDALNALAQKLGVGVYTSSAWVSTPQEAASPTLRQALLALIKENAPAQAMLKPQTQSVPLVVKGRVDELDDWIRKGAHGIYVML